MRATVTTGLLAVLLVGVLVASGPATGAAPHPSAALTRTSATSDGSQGTGLSTSPNASVRDTAVNPTGGGPAEALAERGLAAAQASGAGVETAFVPRPSLPATEVQQAAARGYVAPSYTSLPAPMGVAYDGVSADPNGSVSARVLETTRVRGTVDTSGAGIVGADLYLRTPDAFSIQLNAVVTGVQLQGAGNYTFWAQDVVEYFPTAEYLVLLSNLWNFSGGYLPSDVLYAHGPDGHVVDGVYYYAEQTFAQVRYPWNLTLTLGSTLDAGRQQLSFAAAFTGPNVPEALLNDTFDEVVFNSTGPGGSGAAAEPANFTADGRQLNPLDLPDDLELTIGGPGGGSQVDLTSAEARLALATWNGSAYAAVPAAFDFGSDSGETSIGAAVSWSYANGSGAAAGAPYAQLTAGASSLRGLWNASGAAGAYRLELNVTPSNAFELIEPTGSPSPFLTALGLAPEPELAAGAEVSSLYLPPGAYNVTTELSGYLSQERTVEIPGRHSLSVNLTYSASAGIYTPLWAGSNAQLAYLAPSGNGTQSAPFELLSPPNASIASVFGLYNDYLNPVYPSVFLRNTSAVTVLDGLPNLSTSTNPATSESAQLPATNELPWWLWNVSNLAIVRTSFDGGWVAAAAFDPTFLNSAALVGYGATHDLLWDDTFDTGDRGVLLYQEGGIAGVGPSGAGGNNTIWGTTFATSAGHPECADRGECVPEMPYASGLGLEVAENDDRVFNNYFATPTTAAEPPENLYSSSPATFSVSWNVTPGTGAPPLPDFPEFPLTGPNIVGGAEQAGNYWWDYGASDNPFNGAKDPLGQLPYDEDVPKAYCVNGTCHPHLSPGGDYAPLTYPGASFSRHAVKVRGLPSLPVSGPPYWGFNVTMADRPFPVLSTNNPGTTTGSIELPSGSFTYRSQVPGEELTPREGNVSVAPNSTLVVHLRIDPTYGLLKLEQVGFPRNGSAWYALVVVNSVSEDLVIANVPAYLLLLPRGVHEYSYGAFSSVGYVPTVSVAQNVAVERAITPLRLPFVAYTFAVTFTEAGLPAGGTWSVTVHATGAGRHLVRRATTTEPSLTMELPNGSYGFTVRPPRGYSVASGRHGTFAVANDTPTEGVQFKERGSAGSAGGASAVSPNFLGTPALRRTLARVVQA